MQEHTLFFYQGGTIYQGTHVPVPVAQSSTESEYNSACTAGMEKIDRCEGGLQLAYIGTNNISEPDITPRMKYIMVRLEN